MIYVVSFGNATSGGPETLHQAVHLLSQMGEDARMYYLNKHTTDIPEKFKKYNVKAVDKIDDSDKNILIVPETMTYVIKRYKNIRVCIWWLSKDFYTKTTNASKTKASMKKHGWPDFLFPLAYVIKFLMGKLKIHTYRYHFEDGGRFFHAYNCEYVYQYLLENGVSPEKTLYLCGPLNQTFFDKAKQMRDNPREDIVLYNPKKGLEFTQKIIQYAETHGFKARFIPLKNMTPEKISEYMSKAKVYMDFGNFPGPERIPREAVTMGCNIITSRNGAAANNIDVPIPDDMKYDAIEENIPLIVKRMNDMLENYNIYYPKYNAYRKKVKEQVELFQINLRGLPGEIRKN